MTFPLKRLINQKFFMYAHVDVPPPAPLPGTYVPHEMPPLDTPPKPEAPPEIIEPNYPEPASPVREPGTVWPPQSVHRFP